MNERRNKKSDYVPPKKELNSNMFLHAKKKKRNFVPYMFRKM